MAFFRPIGTAVIDAYNDQYSEGLITLAPLPVGLQIVAVDRLALAVRGDLDRVAPRAGAFQAPIGIACRRPCLGDAHKERLGADAKKPKIAGKLRRTVGRRKL